MLAFRAPHGHDGEAFHDERAASVMATGTLNQERTVRVGHWEQPSASAASVCSIRSRSSIGVSIRLHVVYIEAEGR